MIAMRRSWAAAAIALVAFLTLEVALGAAAASTPDTWEIAPARVGDQGRYDVAIVGDEQPEVVVSDLRFERLPPRIAYRADGTPFVAQVMHESWTQTKGNMVATFWQESLDDGQGGGAVRAKIMEQHWSGWRSRGVGITIGTGVNDAPSQELHHVTTRFNADYGACGLRSNLMLDEPWLGGCRAAMEPLRVVDWNGKRSLVYASADDPGKVQAWMHPDYPVPVQILHRIGESDTYFAFRLAGFTAGNGPAIEPTMGGPLPLPTPVAATEGMPDAQGANIVFPLEEALESAGNDRIDPQGADVAEFLARPNVIIQAASLRHFIEQDYVVREWSIRATDGQIEKSFTVSRDDPADGNPAPFDPLDTAGNTGRHNVDDVETSRAVGPTRAVLPDAMPRVVDIIDTWMANPPAGHEGLTPDAYAFGHECANPECTEVDSWVGAGPQLFVSARSRYGNVAGFAPFPEDATYDVQGSLVKVTGDGQLLRTDVIHQTGHRVNLATLGQTPDARATPSPQSADGGWTPPSGPVTAVAAGVAALVGILAYLVPMLRHGPLAGLFSRITGERLLEHPTRAAIVAAIDAQPGIHFRGLLEALDESHGVLQHHARKLVDAGLIAATTHGNTTSYTIPGRTDRRIAATLPVLQGASARRVFSSIHDAPGITGADLVALTGLSQGTVSHHVARLRKAGLLEARRDGRTQRLHPTDLGRQAASVAA